MKNQALFSSKDKSKNLKCRLLQFLFGALGVKFSGFRVGDHSAGTCRRDDVQVVLTSFRRDVVASTSARRHSDAMCRLGSS